MSGTNDDQKAFWEKFASLWVTQQAALDSLMAPILDRVLTEAVIAPGETVLDIGCGTGISSLRAATATGSAGRVLGVDISEPMLERARATATDVEHLQFETADAAAYDFSPHSFDVVISRFGVMFFVDSIAAFSNIRRGMKPGARLIMGTWSYLDANPWFRVPMYASKRRLGAPPPMDPDGPGPLAFRDITRVDSILKTAGFQNIKGWAETLQLEPPGDLQSVAQHAGSIGPAARTIQHFNADQEDFDAIVSEIAQHFADYMTPQGARIPAAINFFTATAP
ncbi:MAG: class I SAM-dependent methyltransferase [Roseobacter sp.]